MSWDYRVVRKCDNDRGDEVYGIHECFFDEEGRIWACSKEPELALAESPAELRDILIMMLQSTVSFEDIVDYDTIPQEGAVDPTKEAMCDVNERGEMQEFNWKEWRDEFLANRGTSVTCSTCYHWTGGDGVIGGCRARPIGVRDKDFELAKRFAYTYAHDWCSRWEGDEHD